MTLAIAVSPASLVLCAVATTGFLLSVLLNLLAFAALAAARRRNEDATARHEAAAQLYESIHHGLAHHNPPEHS